MIDLAAPCVLAPLSRTSPRLEGDGVFFVWRAPRIRSLFRCQILSAKISARSARAYGRVSEKRFARSKMLADGLRLPRSFGSLVSAHLLDATEQRRGRASTV